MRNANVMMTAMSCVLGLEQLDCYTCFQPQQHAELILYLSASTATTTTAAGANHQLPPGVNVPGPPAHAEHPNTPNSNALACLLLQRRTSGSEAQASKRYHSCCESARWHGDGVARCKAPHRPLQERFSSRDSLITRGRDARTQCKRQTHRLA